MDESGSLSREELKEGLRGLGTFKDMTADGQEDARSFPQRFFLQRTPGIFCVSVEFQEGFLRREGRRQETRFSVHTDRQVNELVRLFDSDGDGTRKPRPTLFWGKFPCIGNTHGVALLGCPT